MRCYSSNALATSGYSGSTLSRSAVDRIDATGLGVLVGALKRLRAGNGQLRLAAASGDVARVLHVTPEAPRSSVGRGC